MQKLLSILLIILISSACKKNRSEDESYIGKIMMCHRNENTDSVKLFQRLKGSWMLWKKEAGGFNPNPEDNSEQVVLNFTTDKKYTVIKNGDLIAQGNFHLDEFADQSWRLRPDVNNEYLMGTLAICGNILVLISRPVDGVDYYYIDGVDYYYIQHR